MITTLVRKIAPLIGLAALMVGFMRGQETPPPEGDLWFHLRLGNEFLGGWRVREPGHFGPFDTADWVPTQWLSQEAMAWVEQHWGLDGVVWAAGVVVMLIIGVLFAACRRVADPLPAAIAVALGVLAASPGFSARPQELSYLFVILTVMAWTSVRHDGRPPYWYLLVAWVWPMCHGMWPVGISISIAALVGLALERRTSARDLLRLALFPVASLLAAGLNPTGFDTYRSIFVIGARTAYFDEWGPPDFTSPPTAVLGVMILVVIINGLRSLPVAWFEVALTVLAIGWSLYSIRTTVVGALVLAPLVAVAIGRLLPNASPPSTVGEPNLDGHHPGRMLRASSGRYRTTGEERGSVVGRLEARRFATRNPSPQRLGHRLVFPLPASRPRSRHARIRRRIY